MNLTPHFTLEELTVTLHRDIDNTMPEMLLPNAMRLAKLLETVRSRLYNERIIVSSAYRCKELNEAVGGARTSLHMSCLAADVICPGFGTVLEVCREIAKAEDMFYDQLIYEYGRWMHIGLSPDITDARRQVFHIFNRQDGYIKGLPNG